MILSQLATEKVLLTLLVEITQDGARYAKWENSFRSQGMREMAKTNNDKLMAASNILASILPGICPAQVAAGFVKFATHNDPDYGFGWPDFVELLAVINV